MRHLAPGPLLAALSLGCLSACGGGGGGGAFAPATGEAHTLIQGGASPDYLSVEASIAEVRLVRDDGLKTANLLGGPVEVEFLGLEEVALLLSSDAVEVGTYPCVEVRFTNGSLAAMDKSGAPVFVVENGMQMETLFDQPLVLQEDGYVRLGIELDVVESLDGDLSAQPVHFDPIGTATLVPAAFAMALEELQGLVVGASLADSELQVQVFQQGAPVGPVTVRVEPDTLLLDLFDVPFADEASFFAAMKIGLTVVEVEGELLGSGELSADRVEILDQAGGGPAPVEIEGLVLYIDPLADEMVLLIQDVVSGQEIADPVLMGIGDPSSIDVDLSGAAFCDAGGQPVAKSSLAVGQTVQVEFDAFVSPPFPAAKVSIEGDVELTGVIQDVSDLPDSFVLRVNDDEPGMGGQDVTVHLEDDTDLCLDIQFQPTVLVEELVVGMKASVQGEPSDDRTIEGIVASKVKVHHGHLIKADVDDSDPDDPDGPWFTTTKGKIVQTFGNLVAAGPLTVEIAPSCLFKQDASSETSFFALIDSGVNLDIKVKGIGSPDAGVIRAYEIKAKNKGGGGPPH